MRLIGFAIYLGIGAMLHAAIIGAHFDWQSAWTFGWLFAWPLMLIGTFGAVIAIGIIVAALVWCAWSYLSTFAHWRAKKR